MELIGSSRSELVEYLGRQLDHFFPDGRESVVSVVDSALDDALYRTSCCIDAAALWQKGRFDPLHSEQNTVFLYFLANSIYRSGKDVRVATKVFYLNKALNGFSCFYDTELPDIWFVGHSPGIVLARATYGNYLALYQNCTIGKNHGEAPVLGEGVLLYPNSAVIGRCQVKDRTVVGQGQRLIDRDSPGDCYIFSDGPKVVVKPTRRDVWQDLFRA